MICTSRDNVGSEVDIVNFGIVKLHHDIVNWEFHRFRITSNDDVVLGDYSYDRLEALRSVFNRFSRKFKSATVCLKDIEDLLS